MMVKKIQILENEKILAKPPQDNYSEMEFWYFCQIPFKHHVNLLGCRKKCSVTTPLCLFTHHSAS